ncbi:hypothetical protein CW704_01725 [Candidatus Bathyarchaeota archaeon]|nr:MAG: hypothetical protein CW704_01725 [Candidatus Bathyarchaeota archaeon]RKY75510.1 MAG: hypothetical protein DRQ00_10390 [candidate division KSB1 bacterium]
MKSRERIIRALELEEPDTVPTFEMIIDPVDTVRAILGREPIYGNTRYLLELQRAGRLSDDKIEWINKQRIRDQYELYSKLDLDMIRYGEWNFKPAESIEKISEDEWVINGVKYVFKGGTLWRRNPVETALRKGPEAVLEKIKDNGKTWIENAKNAQFPGLKYLRKINKEEKFLLVGAGSVWLGGEITFEEWPIFLMWFYRYPDVVEKMINLVSDITIERAKAAIDHGADGILTCNDFGYSKSTWISPQHFRRFIYPNLKRAEDVIKKKGSFFVVHSDGNNEPLLDMFVEAGIDAYQSIDILGGMDLAEVKRRIGDKVCLIGNVDLQILNEGSPNDVKKDVERCINSAAEGGGYIISSSGSMLESNPKNLITMVSHARKIGKYPRPK